ncbi:hypothetical protein MM188_003177 [Vibrio cholerae]|nr:hypothetical protein [Vibrio cholerae]
MISQRAKVGTRLYVQALLNVEGQIKGQLDCDVTPICTTTYRNRLYPVFALKTTTFSETRRESRGKPLCDSHAVDVKVMRAIYVSDPHTRGWVLWCYHNKPNYELIEDFMRYAWEEFKRQHPVKQTGRGKMTPAQLNRVKSLLFLAAYEARHRARHNGAKLYDLEKIRQLGNFTQSSWKDRWRARWELCLKVYEQLDALALTHVHRLESRFYDEVYPEIQE